jgi:membrane protease YdiL (CAAX protease family)
MTEPNEYIQGPSIEDRTDVKKLPFIDQHAIHPIVFALASLILIFFLYQVGGGVLTFFVAGVTSVTADNVWTIRWSTVLGQILFILLPTLVLAKLFANRLHEVFRFRVPGLRESAFALIALFSLQRVFEAYMFFQERVPVPELLREFTEPFKRAMEELTRIIVHAGSPMELIAVIFVIAVVPSVVEELLFRGLIQKVFERLMSPVVAAILSGTIFGLFHINPFEVVPLIGIGVFLGMLRYRSQSLWLPITIHFINNFIAVLATYYGLNDENLLVKQQSTANDGTMLFIFVAFTALFLVSFVAYLRVTHNTSRNIR